VSRPTCCNHNCGQSDRCPLRKERPLTVRERRALIGLAVIGCLLLWFLVNGAPQ
jgi:hypothetical protein